MERYFAGSLITDPLVKEIDALISQYTSDWTGTAPTPHLQAGEDASEDSAAAFGHATRRQQLAIHSLVRRANFVDEDDHVAASPSSLFSNVEFQLVAMPQIQSNLQAPSALQVIQDEMPAVGLWQGTGVPTSNQQPRDLQSGLTAHDAPVEAKWTDPQNCEEWRDEMQFVRNPWMGFSESLESYGLTLSLDDDYF